MNWTVKKKHGVMVTQQGDDLVILNSDTGQYFCVNQTGADIWNILDICNDVESVVKKIEDSYDVDGISAASAVDNFIRQLEARDLVSVMKNE